MPRHEQERQEAQTERLREQVEFQGELVESLKLKLRYQEQELQEAEQELVYTNRDLCNALILEGVCLETAKELAKTILKSKKSVSESLAELLTAIYGSSVRSEELEQIDNSNITMPLKSSDANRIVTNSKELGKRSKQLQVHYIKLGSQFISFKASRIKFKARCAELINKLRDKNNVSIAHNESNFTPPKIKISNNIR